MQKELYGLMLKYSFKPDSKLDQNFIISKSIIDKVVELINPKKEDIILEIGAGTGNLTKELIKTSKVIVIEKDRRMVEILEKELPSENLVIINKDILKVDLNKLKFNKIAGFIPYYISHNIVEFIKGNKPSVIVVQKEFAEKLIAFEGFENYVATSVLAQSYGDIKIIKNIKKNAFFPIPKVDSSIITINPKNKKQDLKYNTFVKCIFRYSNKDLQNTLKLAKKIEPKLFKNINSEKVNTELLKTKVKQLNINEILKIYNSIFIK